MITIPVRSFSFSFNKFLLKENMGTHHKCQLFVAWYAPPINSLDIVFVAFAHTVCVPWILSQEIDGVGPGSGIGRVNMLLAPGWGRSLRVMANAWQVGLHMSRAWGGVVGIPWRGGGKDVEPTMRESIAEGVG